MSSKKLFSEFAPVSKQAWINKVTEDLKGADFEKKLVWKTDDRFPIQPFYTAEDMTGKEVATSLSKAFARDENATGARSWVNYAEVGVDSEAQANKDAIANLDERGADGIIFNLKDKETVDFDVLLNGVEVECCSISFKGFKCAGKLSEAYFAYLNKKGADLSKVSGYMYNDPIALWNTTGKEPCYKCLAKTIKATSAAPHFYGLTIQSVPFVNAGSSYTQEIAFTLAKLTDYIEKLEGEGVSAKEVFENAMPIMGMNTDYFFEISKMRAVRALWIELENLYKAGLDPKSVKIGAESSVWAVSKYDPYVNMLRSTTEGMSAVLGGVDALSIAPYDSTFENPTSFSSRIALNISHLLKEESYFDKVVDPAGGSYYIENLTTTLMEKSLELLKAVEAAGGYVSQFTAGEIQKQIAEVRAAKRKDISSRKRVYVGVNRYPNVKETLDDPQCCGGKKCKAPSEGLELLPSQHAAKPFECLRQRTEMFAKANGRRPRVFMAGYGNPAMRTARVMFAGDFFGSASFEILPDVTYSSAEQAGRESAKVDADIVVICSSDDDYMASAVSFVKEFRAVNKDKILVLAGNPTEIVEELKAAGLNDFIHVRVNALDALMGYQEKLGVKID
ncbi:MAG: methylmalonyl-CoA mutase family protein [Flavobacteriales bacterium]|nr:methylmalonyl-CoA mutase family protein [Flavobacteriales bacterium]